MVGMRERVAEALFYAARMDDWGVANEDEKAPWLEMADAALAVVADVEGIAGVLRGHRFDPLRTDTIYAYRCTCGAGLRKGQTAADHQAEAVAAYFLK